MDQGKMYHFDTKGWFDTTVGTFYEMLLRRKEKVLEDRLKELGFEEFITKVKTHRFKRGMVIKHDGWDYFFIDDGSPSGKFILGTKLVCGEPALENPYKLTVNILFITDESKVPPFVLNYVPE